MLADDALGTRMDGIARDLQSAPGNVHAADLIERLGATGEPVSS